MMKRFQRNAVAWLKQGLRGALFADMGSGKTIITLTHILDCGVTPALVISTKRVCELVWEDEAAQWEHTKDLTFSRIMDTSARRSHALAQHPDIYLINIENVQWLMEQDLPSFKLVVLDELSLWKGMGKRWKAVRKWLADDIPEVIALTGTPVSNGYEGLWPQMELVEKGMLGRTMTLYRQTHFWQEREYMISLRPGGAEDIRKLMAPHVHRISNKDLDMPALVENDIKVRISDPKARQMIGTFRRESYINENPSPDEYCDLGDQGWHPGWEISGNSAASAINKLVQMGNGSVYDDEGNVVFIHNAKRDALKDYISEQQGEPVMIAYYYKHDLTSIRNALPGCSVMDGNLPRHSALQLKHQWNAGKLPYMAIHPGSAGHGLNLQGCHANRILWYSMVHDLDLYDQLNARVCRQGNDTPTVWVDRLIAGPEDRTIATALTSKTSVQDALLQYYEELT